MCTCTLCTKLKRASFIKSSSDPCTTQKHLPIGSFPHSDACWQSRSQTLGKHLYMCSWCVYPNRWPGTLACTISGFSLAASLRSILVRLHCQNSVFKCVVLAGVPCLTTVVLVHSSACVEFYWQRIWKPLYRPLGTIRKNLSDLPSVSYQLIKSACAVLYSRKCPYFSVVQGSTSVVLRVDTVGGS